MLTRAVCANNACLLSMVPICQHLLASYFSSVTHASGALIQGTEQLAPISAGVTVVKPLTAKAQVQHLQAVTGYCFRSEELLNRAVSLNKKDYKPLAYLGDAAVYMLFEEEVLRFALQNRESANHLASNMDTLISRKHFAAVAIHLWKLHRIPSNTNDRALLKQPNVLAEQVEAIIGAMLVDSEFDYDVLSQSLHPWIDATKNVTLQFETAQQQQAQDRSKQRPHRGRKRSRLLLDALVEHMKTTSYSASADGSRVFPAETPRQQLQWALLMQPVRDNQQGQQQLNALIRDSLSTACRYALQSSEILDQCSTLMWHTLSASPATPEVQQQIKFWCRFGLDLHTFILKQHGWQKCYGNSSSSFCQASHKPGGAARTGTRVSNIHRRAAMLKWLGLHPTLWCPMYSRFKFYSLPEEQQAHELSRCLSILLAAVYMDGGMKAATAVADVLHGQTPMRKRKMTRSAIQDLHAWIAMKAASVMRLLHWA